MSKGLQGSRFSSFLIVLILVLAVALAYGAVYAPARAKALFGPADARLNLIQRSRLSLALLAAREELTAHSPLARKNGKFTINPDESVRGICLRLQAEGYVTSGEAVCSFLTYSGLDRMVQSGTFSLTESLSALDISRRISDPAARDIAFRIFPGWRLEEIAEAVDASGFSFSGQEFLAFADNPKTELRAYLNIPEGASLEGYFYPDSYSFEPTISLESMCVLILERFFTAVQSAQLQESLAQQNISLHQAVILASIIERETQASDEKARIASVFYNRLAAGMRLETDPTVQYALGYDSSRKTWWKSPLTLEDLGIDSPYNTYRYTGLPPGPISSPAFETILAAAQPEQTGYYFFRSRCDGSGTHVFSVTYEEHLNNACP
ncbi:MAG: endolytic transglycosylase MltG [Chloroflexi bacterium]|jgi:UPF0755 protein|nr:endolytic transglycosylase MltG [Anaerolineaceae bacterium]NLI43916.1 endolytic transglycosylase MltG [Chloroflexota bacterium]HOT24946.1 endolytic transglycosylase MltG [Anaerolineaceae bacterium]HQH57539.1 endolytic transglycosylase MltG [Anaerolineaceae bacterium]HQK03065.1 endolytic transglycosylase MltG [Anaerolineaceae bacterium]